MCGEISHFYYDNLDNYTKPELIRKCFLSIVRHNINLVNYLDESYMSFFGGVTFKFIKDSDIYYLCINHDDFICIFDKNVNKIFNGYGNKFEYFLKNLLDS